MNKKEEEILTLVEQDIKVLKKELNETVKAIEDGGYSKFPILLAHENEIAIAQKVIEKDIYNTNFNFSASTLEEMVTRKIILNEKQEDFKKQMKANATSFCVLLVHPDSMKFIFTPK
jgi:hypothetical protein